MVEQENGNVAVGSGDVGEGQSTTERTTHEIEGVENSNGQVCIECAACGFAVVRTRSYVISMQTMKCPHCLTTYSVKL